MLPRKIDTLILDLDNTIFDWFAMWYASFKPIYDEILAASGRPQDEVEADIRRVHQTRRTSEYTFLIEELDVLREIRAREDIRTRFHNALETSRHGRDQSLQLYPTVFSSLWRIKNAGTKIIGYTESMRFYSSYRLKRFGLDGVIEILFSPKDHDMPAGVPLDRLRRFPDDFYELQVTKVMHTPPGELKPNPKVLREMIEMVGSSQTAAPMLGIASSKTWQWLVRQAFLMCTLSMARPKNVPSTSFYNVYLIGPKMMFNAKQPSRRAAMISSRVQCSRTVLRKYSSTAISKHFRVSKLMVNKQRTRWRLGRSA